MINYSIVLLQTDEPGATPHYIETLYSTFDPRLALAASSQMQRLLQEYDRRLRNRKFFSEPPAATAGASGASGAPAEAAQDSGGAPDTGNLQGINKHTHPGLADIAPPA